jgi:O-Antigen ligase
MFLCAMQAALTFSRSGIWMSGICILTALCFLARNPRTLLNIGMLAVVVAFLSWFLIVPALDGFTGGKLSERYAQKGFANRETIAQEDILLCAQHPILGIGPGMGKFWRAKEFGGGGAAHTEFTRLLSEHGSLGVLALLTLLGMSLTRFMTPGSAQEMALRGTAIIYSFLFMAVTAMRVAMPGFVFGLAFISLAPPGHRPALPTKQRVTAAAGLFLRIRRKTPTPLFSRVRKLSFLGSQSVRSDWPAAV